MKSLIYIRFILIQTSTKYCDIICLSDYSSFTFLTLLVVNCNFKNWDFNIKRVTVKIKWSSILNWMHFSLKILILSLHWFTYFNCISRACLKSACINCKLYCWFICFPNLFENWILQSLDWLKFSRRLLSLHVGLSIPWDFFLLCNRRVSYL